MDQQKVFQFVNDLRYEVGPAREGPIPCCVDGRVDESRERTPAAVPGADAGYLMAALAALRLLGIQVTEDIRLAIFAAVVCMTGGPERFRFHTDAHAQTISGNNDLSDVVGRGCGHLREAGREPDAYGLVSGDMEAIFDYLVWLLEQGATEVLLLGDHKEKAVLVVDSSHMGVRHGDGHGRQAFVYHAAFDRQRLEDLAHELSVSVPAFKEAGITHDGLLKALITASDNQRNQTLARLAKGYLIYMVTEGGVTPAGTVSAV